MDQSNAYHQRDYGTLVMDLSFLFLLQETLEFWSRSLLSFQQ